MEHFKHILILQTGGTIDKRYPQGPGAYSFEFQGAAVEKILDRVRTAIFYMVETICTKDSQDITDIDRENILQAIVDCEHDLVLVTHGTDTMCETANYLARAGVGQGSQSEPGVGGKTVVLTGSFTPECIKDSDADFNIGFALGFLQNCPPGVFVAIEGRILNGAHVMRSDGKFIDKRLMC